ncbi:MAG: hypothetical protein ACXACR_05475, partial [Candidatus Hodarchaeales archaeon]
MINKEFQQYVSRLSKLLETQMQIASKARNRKLDPKDSIEAKLTFTSKDKIATILNIPGLEEYLPSNLFHHENLVLFAADIAKQIVNGRFVKKSREELILLALHSTLVIISQGLISVPQESIPKVTIGTKSNHLTIYFSNTIRYATGETIGLVILIADYIRHILHLNRFSSTPQIVKRYIEELEIFLTMNDRIQDLRGDIVHLLIQNIGVEISGEAYERIEVKKYRNLPNITNQLRMGMCVALEKIIENINIIANRREISGIPEWEWLKPHFKGVRRQKSEFGANDIRGTQALISKSKKPGGFRLRYGYSRNTGQGGVGIHPATMHLLGLLSPGTNIKIDFMNRPLTVFPVSTLNGPLAELKDGSSVRISSISEIKNIDDQLIQIWEMGDILLSPNDIPVTETIEESAWTEEWWSQEIKYAAASKIGTLENLAKTMGISFNELEKLIRKPTYYHPSPEIALALSKYTKIPIHPYYSFNWNEIAISELMRLIQLISSDKNDNLPNSDYFRTILFQLGAPFTISNEKIYSERFQPFIQMLRGKEEELTQILSRTPKINKIEEIIKILTGIPVKSLCQRRIGLKIIRLEKAEPRKINPPAHILFPIGSFGGPQKNILQAKKEGRVSIQISERFCTNCNISSFFTYCTKCKQKTKQQYVCKNGHISETRQCSECEQFAFPARVKPVDVAEMLDEGFQKTGSLNLTRIKGVSFLNNKNRIPEHMIKGILRSKHDLFVYKDGTTRFDLTNAPLTHFSPSEIQVSVEELKRLGYSHDMWGNDLEREDQLLEIYPYDVIVSKKAGNFLVKVSNFVDDELISLYGLSPYYRCNSIKNIVGSSIIGLSPFSTIAVIGRIIGYTENDVAYAHPLWHMLKTRNCNGDIDSITLLLDVLLNFSTEYIPTSRGGGMDIPAVINLSTEWEEISVYAKYSWIPINLSFFRSLHTNPLKEELLTYQQSYLQ